MNKFLSLRPVDYRDQLQCQMSIANKSKHSTQTPIKQCANDKLKESSSKETYNAKCKANFPQHI